VNTSSNPENFANNSESGIEAEAEDSRDSLWFNAHLELVEANANNWFEALGPQTVQELFPEEIKAQAEIHKHSVFVSGRASASILPTMEINLDELGEPEVLESTELGRAVMDELKSRGVHFRFSDSIPISHFQAIQLEVEDELLGQWATDSGTPFNQHFKVYKNKAGEETGFWFVQLLASPLPLSTANEFEVDVDGEIQTLSVDEELLSKGIFTYGEVSTKAHLPILLKKLAYLGETPFPSSQLMSFSRELAFKDISDSSRPIPSYSILKDRAFLSFASGDEETGEPDSFKSQIVPEMVVFGWRFGKESLADISSFIATIVDGCTRAVSTVEDGYRNFRGQDSSIDYDSSLSNPCSYFLGFTPRIERRIVNITEPGQSRLGKPRWIPVTELGEITKACETAYELAETLINTEDLEDAWNYLRLVVVNDGVGWYIASAINTLEYRFHIHDLPDEPDGLADTEHFLQQAISLNVENESTRALINLGLARMMAGQYEAANDALQEAVNRSDGFGRAEILHYRSLLYAKLGDESSAKACAVHVKRLGGFLAPAYIEEALNLKEAETSEALGSRPVVCGVCGTSFDNEEISFCGSCGVSRGEKSITGDQSIGQGSLRVGFILEIHSINEELEVPLALDSLVDFEASALIGSGYGKIWRAPGALKSFVEEQDYDSELVIDPTSIYSYLEALTGGVSGDLLSISFSADPNPMDFDSASWEAIRKKLGTSLRNDFTLEEHSSQFDSSGQSFYLQEFAIEGENLLSIGKLETAMEALQGASDNHQSAKKFIEFFAPELARLNRLPEYISGHLWAQLLSGCNWEIARQILKGEGSLSLDSDSFTWQVPAEHLSSYPGGYAVAWHRNVRRSLNFNPWPWNYDSRDQNYDSDGSGFYRKQVSDLLGGREPAAQEKISSFAALYLLIDHEDDEEDDAPYTSDKVRNLIENFLSEPLSEFIERNTDLIRQCFVTLREFSSELGDGEEWLPAWDGSEGVLAGVPNPWGGEDNPTTIQFANELIQSVEALWPEFISIASQDLPD
jgi:tetratricopeptide (TPR) repeat protein